MEIDLSSCYINLKSDKDSSYKLFVLNYRSQALKNQPVEVLLIQLSGASAFCPYWDIGAYVHKVFLSIDALKFKPRENQSVKVLKQLPLVNTTVLTDSRIECFLMDLQYL